MLPAQYDSHLTPHIDDGSKDASSPAFLTAGISIPHDDILKEMLAGPDNTDTTSASDSQPSLHIPLGFEPLYDPYDGNLLGHLVPSDASPRRTFRDGARHDQELWVHLSKILELQSHISTLHRDMEGIGSRAGDYVKGKGRAYGRSNQRSWLAARSKTELEDTLQVGDEGEDVKVADVEEIKNREREEEFARLTAQFDARQEAVDKVMEKLDELSHALSDFHKLQTPDIRPHASTKLPSNTPLSAHTVSETVEDRSERASPSSGVIPGHVLIGRPVVESPMSTFDNFVPQG